MVTRKGETARTTANGTNGPDYLAHFQSGRFNGGALASQLTALLGNAAVR